MANRVILGAHNGSMVLRVSRPGYDVTSTSLTRKQLAFDSTVSNCLRVLYQGEVSIPASQTQYTVLTYSPSFPVAPLCIGWEKSSTSPAVYTPVKRLVGTGLINLMSSQLGLYCSNNDTSARVLRYIVMTYG